MGNIKGLYRIYQHTFIDTYAKTALVKLYDRKTAITAADMLNDKVFPFYEERTHDGKYRDGKIPFISGQ